MRQKRNYAYTNLTKEEWDRLSKDTKTVGYETKTDFFTACARLLLYGHLLNEGTPSTVEKEIENNHKKIKSIETQQKSLFKILERTAFPSLAMKGANAVAESLCEELAEQVANDCGTAPEYKNVIEWIKIYTDLRKSELDKYRTEMRTNMKGYRL